MENLNINFHANWLGNYFTHSFPLYLYSEQALWLHRRFLALVLKTRLSIDHTGTSSSNDIANFVDNEFHLHSSCSTVPDSNFEDHQAQALYSATYMLWLVKVKIFFVPLYLL